MSLATKYDAVVIGAGMSGMAAAIRLGMFEKKVLLVEKHTIPGGLNSFYRRAGRNLDVGLHALTNAVAKGARGAPLTKLLKQLRLPYESLNLSPQTHSLISFPEMTLQFSNDFNEFDDQVKSEFPKEAEGWNKLVLAIKEFDEVNLNNRYLSAKATVATFIKDELLLEMIFCPLMIYGSAWEDDMDWSQFVIMFKSIYLEGLARPEGGVRTIINLLTNKLKELEVEVRYACEVTGIETTDGSVRALKLKDRKLGDIEVETDLVLSSAGLPETIGLTTNSTIKANAGAMSFTETIMFMPKTPRDYNQNATLIFHNNREKYHYRKPSTLIDAQSAVICFPNNYHTPNNEEGVARVTFMANYEQWAKLEREQYLEQKEIVFNQAKNLVTKYFGSEPTINYQDTFSPTTVVRYTSHRSGAVYGSPDKTRDGRTDINGLVITGTDQGFLGIVGAMLSGISMANLHGLQGGNL